MRALACAFLPLAIALPAFAGGTPILTGVWEGSVSCKTEDSGGKGSFKQDVTLDITQNGTNQPLVVNVEGSSTKFSGTVIPSAVKPNEGAGALIACGTSDATTAGLFNDIETFHYKIDLVNGSLKTLGSAQVSNGEEVAVCKGSFTRVSTTPPKTVPCDPL